MGFIIRTIVTAIAVGVAAWLVDGITVGGDSTPKKIGTLLAVALIFGLVNAVLKPIIKTIGCAFYVLTLGLIGLVVNALLFLLTDWIAEKINLPFEVTGFWPAFWGAIIVAIVGWILSLVTPGGDD
ncbi:phage holin family protein [Longispora albida]|uniref:phage holin family protein n=1 Tax=Longispora albida TaxID=203523 RepID=UPI00036A8EF8|nr:phage holin family protein [Longispora albida]